MTSSALDQGTHHVTLNGAKLAYHVHGDGPVVVALPGGPGFSWHYLRAPSIEEHAKMIYFEPIGTGDSDRLESPSQYGRARDVADLEELRKHLGLSRFGLLGHSAGGFVAQQYAITYPDNVEQMVLYDTSPTNGADFNASINAAMKERSESKWFPEAAASLEKMFSQILSEPELMALGRSMMPLYMFDYDADPERAQRLGELFHINPVRLQQTPPVPFDFRASLAKLRIPVLVIVGVRDFICAPTLAKMIAASVPDARLVIMERSGHFAHVEEPAVFTRVFAEFIRERTAGGSSS